jgi:hypothetical protein
MVEGRNDDLLPRSAAADKESRPDGVKVRRSCISTFACIGGSTLKAPRSTLCSLTPRAAAREELFSRGRVRIATSFVCRLHDALRGFCS